MAVRLPVEIEYSSRKAKVSAIANAGYETQEPEILVPLSFANKHLYVSKGLGKEITYIAAGGQEVKFFRFKQANVRVFTDDSQSPVVSAVLIVSENEDEIILNDQLIGILGIDLVNVANGKWRFSDDPYDKLRDSSQRQLF